MRIRYAYVSTEGSARQNNEDSVASWEPTTAEQWRSHGALVVIADGMGGQVRGEVASRMACDRMVAHFAAAAPLAEPSSLVRDGISAANLAVYDDNLTHQRAWGKMATTLTACLFRDDEVTIGHVGDCRVYVVQQSRIRQVTSDHSYTAVQQRLGLISAADAAGSENRSMLTRSIGNEPFVRADVVQVKVGIGDVIVQCCDGLWSKVTEGEILSIVTKRPADEACRELIRLAEKRFADDNLTVQVVHVVDIERRSNMRGPPAYWKERAATMDDELSPGFVLDDRYRIIEPISKSGMAFIYKAEDLAPKHADEATVALKVPLLRYESDPGFFSRFEQEQKIGHAMDHPYVLALMDAPGQHKSRPYMVMEYLDGQTLGQLMRTVAPLPERDACEFTARICDALEYMHGHNVVHRDLKPDNIMILSDGSIRIMDFGIAKYEGQRRLTFGAFTPTMGTPDYMAPEQVRGKRGDRRTDIYSLGAILYEMLTDRVPFPGENPFVIMNNRVTGDPPSPRGINPAISPQVEEIVLHAMARNPDDRYPDAAAMRAELEHPDRVEVTGRVHRLVEPHPLATRWRRYRLIIVGAGMPLLALLALWLSRHLHVQFR
jgi:serine/threonine-protein kinase